MKKLLRHPAVQRMLSAAFSTYLKALYLTLRWTHEGRERAQGVWAAGESGAILCLWHSGIPISAPTWDLKKGQDLKVLISKSSDGEFITQVMKDLGFGSIRGSRQRENSLGDKGGAAALREMVKWVKAGGAVAITPDGPKGPPQVMSEGAPILAKLTGAPVLLVGLACTGARAKTWDRTFFPLPFSRAAMVWDGPINAGRDDEVADLVKAWGERLNAVAARAAAIVA